MWLYSRTLADVTATYTIESMPLNGYLVLMVFLLCCQSSFAQVADSILTQARAKENGRLITVNNRYRLWVQQAGSGKNKLLILPGGPGNSHYGYEPFLHLLPQHDLQVYILDMVDCGLSDRTQNKTYWSITNYIQDIESVRSALGLDRFYLLGHSFGGMLAFEYAAAHPDRLQGLLISNMTDSWQGVSENVILFMDSLSKQHPFAQQLRKQAQGLDSSSVAFRTIDYQLDSLTRALFDKAVTLSPTSILPQLKPFYTVSSDTLIRQNVAVFRHFYGEEEFLSWDFRSKLAGLSMPVLLLGGGHDYALSWADMLRMKQELRHGVLAYCDQGDHVMFWRNYGCYYEPILIFLGAKP
jgi:proline iminopeptidase